MDWPRLLATLVGIGLVIGSACVFNNYIDRDIDSKMARTRTRAIPSGQVSAQQAITYGAVLGLAGLSILAAKVNLLSVALGLFAMFAYVVVYGFAKRTTPYGTLVGTISGAVPPVAGYAAATGRLDLAAALLFLVLVAWQMPHFYAISIFRIKEYEAAGLPVWPLKKGMPGTKKQMLGYLLAFIAVCALFTITGYTGLVFLAIMGIVWLYWLVVAIKGFGAKDNAAWARKMFSISLIVLLVLSIMLSVGGQLV